MSGAFINNLNTNDSARIGFFTDKHTVKVMLFFCWDTHFGVPEIIVCCISVVYKIENRKLSKSGDVFNCFSRIIASFFV